MADNNFFLQSLKFYKFGEISLWLSIVHNKSGTGIRYTLHASIHTPITVKPKLAPAAPI